MLSKSVKVCNESCINSGVARHTHVRKCVTLKILCMVYVTFFSIAVFSEREVLKVIATSQPVITDYETPLHYAISKAQLPNTADSLQKDSSQRHCYLHGCL